MYKISVPFFVSHLHRSSDNDIIKAARNIGANRVFLGLTEYNASYPEKRAAELEELKKYTALFKSHGFEVGAWLWAFMVRGSNKYIHMEIVSGGTASNAVCPSDEGYRTLAAKQIADIAQCGVDMIMFDDDFRYGYTGGGFGCLCKNHLIKISELLGEEVNAELMRNKLLFGGANKYRDAFIAANGYWLEKFASDMRAAVDKINPDIRFGQCTCMSSWDIDGTTPDRISSILAGKTRPFYRLIGAPYWANENAWGNRLQDVIELERMESSFRKLPDAEIFAEGDVWPRPRWATPSAYLEGFDTAVRAAGCTNGILKYTMDYTSSVNYEKGYVDNHIRNKELYCEIDRYFGNKTSCGVRVYESPQKYAHQDIYSAVEGNCDIEDIFFSQSARMLSCCGIPTVYSGSGQTGIVFGSSAYDVSEANADNGLIIDIEAARILTERGWNVGIINMCEQPGIIEEEYFVHENEYIPLINTTKNVRCCKLLLNEGAEIQSFFVTEKGEKLPASYYFCNNAGQRFLVFNFETYFATARLSRSYARARQLSSAVQKLSGKPLPAEICRSSPDLYMQCKSGTNSLAVGLWNFCIDAVMAPKLKLDRKYENINFINCTGRMDGRYVYLSDIPSYEFAGFEVR